MAEPTVSAVSAEERRIVSVTASMDPDTATRLAALLLHSVDWNRQRWARAVYEAFAEVGVEVNQDVSQDILDELDERHAETYEEQIDEDAFDTDDY